jgi:hypothetical protein
MTEQPQRNDIVDQTLVAIAHSQYSEPVFIVEGIGPATFRSHFLKLGNGIVILLFVADITFASIPVDAMPAETNGIPPANLIGRRVKAVVRDDAECTVVVLEGGLYLADANDAFTGNPLLAAHLTDYERLTWGYSASDRANFFDYWTGELISRERFGTTLPLKYERPEADAIAKDKSNCPRTPVSMFLVQLKAVLHVLKRIWDTPFLPK